MASSSLSKIYPQKKNKNKKSGAAGPYAHGKGHKVKHLDAVHSALEDASTASATLSAQKSQPAALVSNNGLDLRDEYDEIEGILRKFDMDMRYGPCLGMTRQERWERANAMGLHPPIQVKEILERHSGDPACLWEGRI